MDIVEIVRTCTWVSEGDAVSGQVRFCGGFGRTDVAVAHSLHIIYISTFVNHLGCHDCERFREHDPVPL